MWKKESPTYAQREKKQFVYVEETGWRKEDMEVTLDGHLKGMCEY